MVDPAARPHAMHMRMRRYVAIGERMGSPVGGGGGVARAEDAAALGDLLLEVVGVERVVRR